MLYVEILVSIERLVKLYIYRVNNIYIEKTINKAKYDVIIERYKQNDFQA